MRAGGRCNSCRARGRSNDLHACPAHPATRRLHRHSRHREHQRIWRLLSAVPREGDPRSLLPDVAVADRLHGKQHHPVHQSHVSVAHRGQFDDHQRECGLQRLWYRRPVCGRDHAAGLARGSTLRRSGSGSRSGGCRNRLYREIHRDRELDSELGREHRLRQLDVQRDTLVRQAEQCASHPGRPDGRRDPNVQQPVQRDRKDLRSERDDHTREALPGRTDNWRAEHIIRWHPVHDQSRRHGEPARGHGGI